MTAGDIVTCHRLAARLGAEIKLEKVCHHVLGVEQDVLAERFQRTAKQGLTVSGRAFSLT